MAVSPAAILEAPRNPGDNSPDWDNVPFHVGCARCGADLRGQSEPKCKSCGLEFDWADAVPIEQLTCKKCGYHLFGLRGTRCPECGSEFTWDEALARFHRQRLPYFEYRWRDRPIRSFICTWWMSLRPRKFWRTMQLHDPPQAIPLILQLFGSLVLLAIPLKLVQILEEVVLQAWTYYTQNGMSLSLILSNSLTSIMSLPSLRFLSLVAGWWISSFAALLIFQQSMRRIHVRTIHVLRIVVCAIPACLPIAVLVLGFTTGAVVAYRNWIYSNASWVVMTNGGRFAMNNFEALYFVAGAIVFLHTIWSLRCAYKFHLKMPHSFGVAIAAQIIAILAAPIVAFPLIWLINS